MPRKKQEGRKKTKRKKRKKMIIELIATKPRDSKRQFAFIKVDDIEFSVGNVPIGLTEEKDVQAHLDARADEFKLLILRKQYRESDYLRFQVDDKTELEAMKEWISKGHKNKIKVGVYEIIEKQELKYKHPKWIGLTAKIENLNISIDTPIMTAFESIKDLLKEIVK